MKLLLVLSIVLLVEWMFYPPPILSESPNGYIGCFVDGSTRDLNGGFYSGPLTIQYCRTACQKYAYFGMQNGNECYCGNSYGSLGQAKESECGTQCEGDSSQLCGGEWRNSVYRTVASCEIVPVSRGKKVSQSSQYFKKIPQFAVDGNYTQTFGSDTGDQTSCASTNLEANPWWKVDLGLSHHVDIVKIWNRGDCCGDRLNGLKVQLSNDDLFWTDVATMNENAVNGGMYTIQVNGVGRYVRLTLPRTDYLTLCEVDVFGRQADCQPTEPSLLSRGKKVSQSSQYYKKAPQFAVDGNYTQVLSPDGGDQVSCSCTNADNNPWWKVDLEQSQPIYGVKVWNRADCCGERLTALKVQLSDDDVNWKDAGALNENTVNGGIYAIKVTGSGRYVRLTLPRTDYLTLCEVEVYGAITECPTVNPNLVSRGKKVSQSSQYYKKIPQFAVDGNYIQAFGSDTGDQTSCASTNVEANPWWQVDLERTHQIFNVKLWNRADCCGNRLNALKVQLSDDGVFWSDVASMNENAANSGIYSVPVNAQGRYVRLMLPRVDYLTLCEVEVYGKPLECQPGELTLLSRGKKVSQSSQYYKKAPQFAVDGDYIQAFGLDWGDQVSCACTNAENNPWWKVDLGQSQPIYGVKVWNRADCCGERLTSLIVQLSDDDKNWKDAGILKESAVNGGIYAIRVTGSGRYVRLTLPRYDYLTLCEVEVYSRTECAEVNANLVSRGKPVSQSSQYYKKVPQFAVDGTYTQTFGSDTGDQISCACTNSEANPWWKVDLGKAHQVVTVKVWNRADCCGERLAGLKVQLSDDDIFWTDVASMNENAFNGGIYRIDVKGSGRYVRLMLPRVDYLTLCEVEVYGIPSDCQPGQPAVVSRGKSASQSSQYYKKDPGFAVDGNYIQAFGLDWGDQVSCSCTNYENNPWWKVDLGQSQQIYAAKVWNRADCCGERLNALKVQLSDDNVNFKDAGSLIENAVNGGVYGVKVNGSGRYVRLTVPRADYLTLCEVELYAPFTQCPVDQKYLVSRGKRVSQSSQYNKKIPQFAVDGNYIQTFGSDTGDQTSCASTNLEANPWWKVDLERTHHVFSVKVWNRGDCCGERLSNLKVQLSHDDVTWRDVASLNRNTANSGIYSISVNAVGRYVRLTLPRGDYLTLCEVEVYGKPYDC